MVDFVEIHTLLKDYQKGDAGAFFTFNEIKNILLDQNDFTLLESMLLHLFKSLKDEEKLQVLPLICSTKNGRLNRLALFMQKEFILEHAKVFEHHILKLLLNPALNIPKDSFDALYALPLPLTLHADDILALIEAKALERLSFLAPSIASMPLEEKLLIKEPLLQSIERFSHLSYHGITIDKVDTKALKEALN